MKRVLILGAGIGGLTTGAVLARAGFDVTVLEAHVYAGGSAGTFYHQKYRFDAGATLAGGFYPGGPMDLVAKKTGINHWPGKAHDPAMIVHLPDGSSVPRYGSSTRHGIRQAAFGDEGQDFFRWQEETADALWDLALRSPAWPPQSIVELARTVQVGLGWIKDGGLQRLKPGLLLDFLRPAAAHLPAGNQRLRQFIDGQLLISAQTTSQHANALYAASALDLPRRGVRHLPGGMGTIADLLVDAVRRAGGRVLFRQEVNRLHPRQNGVFAVTTRRGDRFEADLVVANLPPWNIRDLMGELAPKPLQRLPHKPQQGWGAFMLYLGIDEGVLPSDFSLHHQVIRREPLGETNSIFISISPDWDTARAPQGKRAVTISTHTSLEPWWSLFENDRAAYEKRKLEYTASTLAVAESILPGLRESIDLELPGTPVTFQRFTRRSWGWVGGFPQTSLLRTWAPRLADNLWMVGDSIFPGQSTAAVALGGLRVADDIVRRYAPTEQPDYGDNYALSGD